MNDSDSERRERVLYLFRDIVAGLGETEGVGPTSPVGEQANGGSPAPTVNLTINVNGGVRFGDIVVCRDQAAPA